MVVFAITHIGHIEVGEAQFIITSDFRLNIIQKPCMLHHTLVTMNSLLVLLQTRVAQG
jgi:hypothetical protein